MAEVLEEVCRHLGEEVHLAAVNLVVADVGVRQIVGVVAIVGCADVGDFVTVGIVDALTGDVTENGSVGVGSGIVGVCRSVTLLIRVLFGSIGC